MPQDRIASKREAAELERHLDFWQIPTDYLRLRRHRRSMMAERRKHPRTELNEPAYISAGGSVMSCVISNISLDGAAIEVDNPAFVPERFRLVMSDHTVHECRVIWIRDKRMGLAFLTPPQSAKPGDD